MNAHRDPDRLIHDFVLEGAERLHDRVYDATRAEIERRTQRVVIGPWRMPDLMNRLIAFGGAAVALILAVVIGTQLLAAPGTGGTGAVPSATPSPTSPTPSISPSPAPSPTAVPEGLLPAGSHVLRNPDSPEWPGGLLTTVTIPGPGWYGEPAAGVIENEAGSDPPAGAGMIGPWFEPLYVFGDPCAWSTTRPDAPATTVDELMAALAAQALRDASAPVDITLDGHAGKSITLHVPDDADFGRCDQDKFGSWTVATSLEPERYHQGLGQIDEIWAVDVDGELVVVDWDYYEGTPRSVIDELRTIVESITFE